MSARGLDYLVGEPERPTPRVPTVVRWVGNNGRARELTWHPTPYRSGWQADCRAMGCGGQFFCEASALRPMFARCTRCRTWARCP